MIYFIDFDYTIADTSITEDCKGNYKDKQKLIPQFRIYPEAIKFIESAIAKGNEVYIVSGNVGSTIKKTIKYFNLPIDPNNVIGYRQGMPMDNLKRKIAVIKFAINYFNLEDRLSEIEYIGDEPDDETACNIIGINYYYPDWIN